MMDASEAFVLTLGAVIGVLLAVIAVRWRSTLREGPGLPIWRFLRREGITRDDAADTLSGKALMQAHLSCAVCGSREECRARLAAPGAAIPPENCPNARCFDEFGLRLQTGQITNARLAQKPNTVLDFTNASRSKGPKPAL